MSQAPTGAEANFRAIIRKESLDLTPTIETQPESFPDLQCQTFHLYRPNGAMQLKDVRIGNVDLRAFEESAQLVLDPVYVRFAERLLRT